MNIVNPFCDDGMWSCGSYHYHWLSNAVTDFTESKVKWITVTDMPENLTNCDRLTSMHARYARYAQLRFWVRCRRGVDTQYASYGLSLSNSVAQSVPTWATAAVACFHRKFAANWRAKFVHCHVHWWCLLYESMRSTYQTSERWSDVNAKSQGMYAIFDLTRRYGNENGNGRSAASGALLLFA